MNHLEIEYKTLLTKDEYNRLAVLFSHVTPVTQTNYYIDTPQGDMRNKRLSLRIRTLPTHGELTLKIPEKVGNMEYNVTMDCSEAKAMTKSLDFPECQIKSILLELSLIHISKPTTLCRVTPISLARANSSASRPAKSSALRYVCVSKISMLFL